MSIIAIYLVSNQVINFVPKCWTRGVGGWGGREVMLVFRGRFSKIPNCFQL